MDALATPSTPVATPAPAAEGALLARRALLIQAATLNHTRHGLAATALATELAAQFGCSRALVGVLQRGGCELVAVSHGGGDRLLGEAFDAIAAAMDEAIQQGSTVHLPAGPQDPVQIRLAHQRWQQRQGGSVLTVPLVHAGQVVGALACEWVARRDDLARLGVQIEDVAAFAGPLLNLLHEREKPWLLRLRQRGQAAWQSLRYGGNRALQLGLAGVVLGLSGLLLVPVDHEVGGKARIEGEQQRALAAPVDGFLQAVHARPGDRVHEGQVLAELADQDLQLEQRRWRSELGQQESAYALALSRADRAQMVIAMARAEQAGTQLAKAESQLQRARLVAPFDGVLLQGDLAASIGAPVERGKPLLVVAPDQRFRIVVEIDERDIAHLAAGQPGALALAAMPWQRVPLQVTRITPVARAAEGRNVFEVEAAPLEASQGISPGLEGVARVTVGRAPLAWIWTHRFVDWLRLQLWSWGV